MPKHLSFKKLLFTLSISSLSHAACAATMDMNPFQNAKFYIDSDYQAEVANFFLYHPDYKKKDKIKAFFDQEGNWNLSTAVWLDSKATISSGDGKHGVLWHLQEALAQVKNNKPITLTFVVYDLPNRDCAAYSSNGEIVIDPSKDPMGTIALAEYKTNYINPIVEALNQFYKNTPQSHLVRTVLVIEPDSLPNMITNQTATSSCQIVAKNNIYQKGIAYGLDKFSTLSNVFIYLDIAHSGWLGWSENANKIHSIYNENPPEQGGLGKSFTKIRGFITNTANYTPLQENFSYSEYLKNNTIISSPFYQWNDSYSEASFIGELMSLDASNGGKLNQDGHHILKPTNPLFANKHFLVDTSRNGWSTTSLDLRLDRRHFRGNWCNIENILQSDGKITGAAFGAVPAASPNVLNPLDEKSALPIDAFVWIKPPGESDGFFDSLTGKGDKKCGTDQVGGQPTDAMQDNQEEKEVPAPIAGEFFDRAFASLIDLYSGKSSSG